MKHAVPAMLLAFAASAIAAGADPRYCGSSERDADGRIHRSQSAKAEFAKLYACPATGKHVASCPGWQIDHVIPLADGGCDTIVNMQWLPVAVKTCAGKVCKDRWERETYRRNQ